jgi:hypothetical protein
MAYIGQVSALFTASTGGLVKGVEQAKRAIEGFKQSAGKAAAGAGTGLDSLATTFGKLPGGIGSSVQSLQTFGQGLSALRTVFAGVAGGAGATGGSLAALAPAFGPVAAGAGIAAAAVAGLGAALGSIGGDVERTAQLAERLGVSFNTMQKLGLAAQYAGVETELLAAGFGRLGRSVLAASEGDKKAIKGFQTLGLSLEELKNSSPEQQFNTVRDSLLAIEDPAKRNAAAIAIFGKSGLELLPVFGAMAQAEKDMTRLGVAFSQIDVDRFSALDDGFDRLGAAAGALGRTLVKPFVELFAYSAEGFAEFAGGLTAVIDPIADALSPLFGIIGLGIQNLGKSFNILGRVIGLLLTPVKAFGGALTAILSATAAGFEAVYGPINAAIDKIQGFLGSIPLIGGLFKKNNDEVADGNKKLVEQAEKVEEIDKAAKKLGDKWRTEISKSLETPLSNYQQKLEEISNSDLSPADAIKAGDLAVEQFVKELDIKFTVDQTPVEKYNDAINKSNAQLEALSSVTATSAAQEKTLADARKAALGSQTEAVKKLVSDLGLSIKVDPTPVEKYNAQLEALNSITASTAEQEKILGDARAAATKAFLDSLPDAKAVATPFEEMNKKLAQLDSAAAGLDPIDDSAAIQEIEAKKARIREEYVNKELGSEQSRRAGLERQLAELEQIEQQFANNPAALEGIKEKRAKIEKELSEIGKAAADAIAADRDRVNSILGKADTKQFTQDIEAIQRERDRAQAAFDAAMQSGNIAAADQAEARLDELKKAEALANKSQRGREQDAAGISDIIKPVEDAASKMRSQLEKLNAASESGLANSDEYANGLANIFKEGIDIQKQFASELKQVNQTALKGSDIRSGEGIAEYIRLATGREDPAVQQRREQLDKLASIESILREQGMTPAVILGG